MKFYLLLFIAFLFAGSCKKTTDNPNDVPKNNCADCFYYNLIDTLNVAPQFDSASVRNELNGVWGLNAVSIYSKNTNRSLIYSDSMPFKIQLKVTDSTYAFYRNDSLITACKYSVLNEGVIDGNGCGFYYGKLYQSEVKHKGNYIGIGSVYPPIAYFLVFSRVQ